MKARYAFIVGAGYGLLMRFGFGVFDSGQVGLGAVAGVMLASFVILVPFVIGVITVRLTESPQRTIKNSLLVPWMPTLACALGSGLLLLEGSICIAIALPIFLIQASLGGIAAFYVLKWRKPSSTTFSFFLVAPLAFGIVESKIESPLNQLTSRTTIEIAAGPQIIWQLINNASDIKTEEMEGGVAYLIGVPFPMEARTISNGRERVRRIIWEGGITFDERITEWKKNSVLGWDFVFTSKTFPPGSLDDHVRIGGRYFDLMSAKYEILSVGENLCNLTIIVNYQVRTNFNWYSGWWAKLLIGDTSKVILNFYKQRAENLKRDLTTGSTATANFAAHYPGR